LKKKKRKWSVVLVTRHCVRKFVITSAKATIINWINWLTPEGNYYYYY